MRTRIEELADMIESELSPPFTIEAIMDFLRERDLLRGKRILKGVIEELRKRGWEVASEAEFLGGS